VVALAVVVVAVAALMVVFTRGGVAASDFDPTYHADFGAATHPGVGGGTHRRRATVERC